MAYKRSGGVSLGATTAMVIDAMSTEMATGTDPTITGVTAMAIAAAGNRNTTLDREELLFLWLTGGAIVLGGAVKFLTAAGLAPRQQWPPARIPLRGLFMGLAIGASL